MKIIRNIGFSALLIALAFTVQANCGTTSGKAVSFLQQQPSNDDCLACHSDKSMSMDRNGKEISLFVDEKVLQVSPHKKLECVSCHDGFNPEEMPHKENIQPIDCMTCHKDAKIKHLFHPRMMLASKNAEGKDVSCKSCHGKHDAKPYKNIGRTASITVCAGCHNNYYDQFRNSVHGFGEGANEKPGCINCHKFQVTKGTYGGDMLRLRTAQQELCLSCHSNDPLTTSRFAHNKSFVAGADSNTHGKLLKAGNGNAASCVDCHQSHKIMRTGDPASTVFGEKVPETCGKCHKDIKEDYAASVHFAAFKKSVKDAPVCSGCHNEHKPVTGPGANLCGSCHKPVEINPDFAQSTSKTKVAKTTYHGIEVKDGKETMANCASCHGPHKILRSEDPASRVNKKKLQETCGSCHPGAGNDFINGEIHKNPGKPVKAVVDKKETKEDGQGFGVVPVLLVITGLVLVIGFLAVLFKRKKASRAEN